MYFKLAFRNVKRQMENYLIYFMTVALTVALLFAINNIIYSSSLSVFLDRGEGEKTALKIMVIMISMVVAFVLGYATSFLLKRRKREFGVYLTLGMTRRNLLTIFLAETLIICSIALGAGLAAGAFFFQGMMAVMMKLLEMEFSIAAYSAEGLFRTVLLTMGIFLTASGASAAYLKRVSIYNLIHGEKKVEKGVRCPLLWFLVTVVSFFVLLFCGIRFWEETDRTLKGGMLGNVESLLAGFILSVLFLHIGVSRSIVFLLLRRPKFRSRGANTFVLRQLSGSLSANSIMFGCMALLMSFAVVGTNFSFIQKAGLEEALNMACPCDVMYYSNKYYREGEIPLAEAEGIIEEYAGIERTILWHMFETGEKEFYRRTVWYEKHMAPNDSFMPLGDFNALMGVLGVKPIELDGQFMIVCNDPKAAWTDWSDMVWEHGGAAYTFHSCSLDYPKVTYQYFYVVAPDEAVAGMECVEENRGYITKRHKYDGTGMQQALARLLYEEGYGESDERIEFVSREYVRQVENNQMAVMVVGALFASAVFLLLAMAILALKTLSALGEDRQRYGILFRLGMGEREQAKALFRQTFLFFLLPFVLPMAMSIPVAAFGVHAMRVEGMESAAEMVPLIAGIVAAVMAFTYLLYYTAAYLIAKRTVVNE